MVLVYDCLIRLHLLSEDFLSYLDIHRPSLLHAGIHSLNCSNMEAVETCLSIDLVGLSNVEKER